MVREAMSKDLKEILELYLYLHEESIPKYSNYLHNTWKQIPEDENHLIANENVVTHTDFKGQGLASECLEYTKQTAMQYNCYKMILLTESRKKRHWISIEMRDIFEKSSLKMCIAVFKDSQARQLKELMERM